jgi:hypothetical protein
MPALPDVPENVRVDLYYTIGEDLAAKNRFFLFYVGSAPTVAQLNTYAADISATWGADIAPSCTGDRKLTKVVVTDLTSSTAAVGEWVGSIAGTDLGQELPASMCVLSSLVIARRYRGGHPRIYWPMGAQPDMQDSQTWKSSSVTTFTTAINNFMMNVKAFVWPGGVSLDLNNVSYYEGFTVHTGTTGRARNVSTVRLAPVTDVVLSLDVRLGIASQRKRLLRLA